MDSAYSMETPCCGAPVLLREQDWFEEGEAERCPDCGDIAVVHADIEEPSARLVMENEPPDNWPSPHGHAACDPTASPSVDPREVAEQVGSQSSKALWANVSAPKSAAGAPPTTGAIA